MWLSSLNIFEENQFYEIKKKHFAQLICGCIRKLRMGKNETKNGKCVSYYKY